jgi:hypothetical protein
MMWFLFGVSDVPTPNVHADIWDHVESYAIHMLLAHRLKIIPKSNLKLIISFLVLHILLLSLFKLLSLVASTWHACLISHIVLRLANRPSALLGHLCFLCRFFNLKRLILPSYKVNRHYFLIHLGLNHT